MLHRAWRNAAKSASLLLFRVAPVLKITKERHDAVYCRRHYQDGMPKRLGLRNGKSQHRQVHFAPFTSMLI